MKEYRLLSWTELPPGFQRTAFRRALSELSARHVSAARLAELSGLRKHEVRALVDLLDGGALLDERDTTAPDSFLDSIGKLGWFRRSGADSEDRR